MAGVFITGTDTGVGKTFVGAALLSVLCRAGRDAVPMKPVQTGCTRCGKELVAPDLEFCLAAASPRTEPGEAGLMCPCRFEPPCSPHLAAARAGREIELDKLAAAFHRLSERHAFVVAEGAGGVLAPLNAEATMLDLMRALGLPVLLVARPGLGTLNHTLLSLRALRAANLTVVGVVFNEARPAAWTYVEEDNLRTVAAMGGAPVWGALRHCPQAATAAALADAWQQELPAAAEILASCGVNASA